MVEPGLTGWTRVSSALAGVCAVPVVGTQAGAAGSWVSVPWNQLASTGSAMPETLAVSEYCQKLEYDQSPNSVGPVLAGT